MKRWLAGSAGVLARLLMLAAARLLGQRHRTWARAMQAEAASLRGGREVLAFAWGCFCAALGLALRAGPGGLAGAQAAGVACCAATVVAGCAFMLAAGAPAHLALSNLVSLVLAVATFCMLPVRRLQVDPTWRAWLSVAMGGGLLMAALDQAPAAASAWLRLGPVAVNLAWLLVPAWLLVSDVRAKGVASAWAWCGLVMGSTALALMAELPLLGVAAVVLSWRAWQQREASLSALAAAHWAAVAWLGLAWQPPAATAFVDQVVARGFEQHVATGLALALLQALPLWPACRHRSARLHGLVWGLLIALSLPGWLPSPLLGFGGSVVLAYMLSLAVIGGNAAHHGAAEAPAAAVAVRSDPPAWPRSGLT